MPIKNLLQKGWNKLNQNHSKMDGDKLNQIALMAKHLPQEWSTNQHWCYTTMSTTIMQIPNRIQPLDLVLTICQTQSKTKQYINEVYQLSKLGIPKLFFPWHGHYKVIQLMIMGLSLFNQQTKEMELLLTLSFLANNLLVNNSPPRVIFFFNKFF